MMWITADPDSVLSSGSALRKRGETVYNQG